MRGEKGSWKEGFDRYEDYQRNDTDVNHPMNNDAYIYRIYHAGAKGPIVFCIHGAGATGLSFTMLAVGLMCSTPFSEEYQILLPRSCPRLTRSW